MIQHPDQRWHVMISSTKLDLDAERRAAYDAIVAEGLDPWWFEAPDPRFHELPPRDYCRAMAEQCDLFVLILGPHYGYTPEGQPAGADLSVTQMEYEWAAAANRAKVLVFVRDDALDTDDPRQRRFIAEMTNFDRGHLRYPAFHSPGELVTHIQTALAHWLRQDTGGRDRYLAAVRERFATFTDPLTGANRPYGTSVALSLETEVETKHEEREARHDGDSGGSAASSPASALASASASDKGADRPAHGSAPVRDDRARENDRERITGTAPELLDRFARLVVLGEPGAGKSTLLRLLARDTASGSLSDTRDARLPIYVSTAELARTLAKVSDSGRDGGAPARADLLVRALAALADEQEPDAGIVIQRAYARGLVLLLVDGLDEPSEAERERVLAALGAIGGSRAIVASRPSAYQSGALPGWQACRVQRLDEAGRLALIERVLAEVSPDAANRPAPEEVARALADRRELDAWAGNPLLLTLVTTQYARDRALPEARASVYSFALEELLFRNPGGGLRRLRRTDLERYLQGLALRMMERNLVTVAPDEVAELAPAGGDRLADDLAGELLARAAVVQQQSPGRWGFIHLTFQEYLAARAIALLDQRQRLEILLRHRLSARWEQVYLLCISEMDVNGRPEDADEVILALARADDRAVPALHGRDLTHSALMRAAECQQQRVASAATHPPAEELRRRLLLLWRGTLARAWATDASVYSWLLEDPFYAFSADEADDDRAARVAGRYLLSGVLDGLHVPKWKSLWSSSGTEFVTSMLILAVLVRAALTLPPVARVPWSVYGWAALPLLLGAAFLTLGAVRLLALSRARKRLAADAAMGIVESALYAFDVHGSARELLRAVDREQGAAAVERMLRGTLTGGVAVAQEAQAEEQLARDALAVVAPLIADPEARVRDAATFLTVLLVDAVPDLKHDFERDLKQTAPAFAWEALWSDRAVLRGIMSALKIASAQTLEQQLALLSDPDEVVWRAAAKLVGEHGDEALPRVVRLAHLFHTSSNPEGRAALLALGAMGELALPELRSLARDRDSRYATTSSEDRSAMIEALGMIGMPALPDLMVLWADPRYRYDASTFVEALRSVGEAAGPALLALARSPETPPNFRAFATEALALFPSSDALRLLADLLRDPEHDLASVAARALAVCGADGATVLVEALHDPRADVRTLAAVALADEDRELVPPEISLALAHDSDSSVRTAAAALLGGAGPRGASALVALIDDPDDDVASSAIRAIADSAQVPDVLARLRHLARHGTPKVRCAAIDALGSLTEQAQQPLSLLMSLLADPDPEVRWRALNAIIAIGPQPALPALLPLLDDADHMVRTQAALVVGTCGPAASSAAAALGRQLRALDGYDLHFPLDALKQIGPAAVAAVPELCALVEAAMRENEYSNLNSRAIDAAELLGNLGPPAREAVPVLRRAARGKSLSLRDAAEDALTAIEDNGGHDAVALLAARSYRRRLDAQSALETRIEKLTPREVSAVRRLVQRRGSRSLAGPLRLTAWVFDGAMMAALLLAQVVALAAAVAALHWFSPPGPAATWLHLAQPLLAWWVLPIIVVLYILALAALRAGAVAVGRAGSEAASGARKLLDQFVERVEDAGAP